MIVVLVVLGMGARRSVRENYYPWFYLTHHLSISFSVALLVHGSGHIFARAWAPFFVLPALLLCLLERYLRWRQLRRPCRAQCLKIAELHAGRVGGAARRACLIELSTSFAPGTWRPGQYIKLKWPTLSILQLHPFYVVSNHDDHAQGRVCIIMAEVGWWTMMLGRVLWPVTENSGEDAPGSKSAPDAVITPATVVTVHSTVEISTETGVAQPVDEEEDEEHSLTDDDTGQRPLLGSASHSAVPSRREIRSGASYGSASDALVRRTAPLGLDVEPMARIYEEMIVLVHAGGAAGCLLPLISHFADSSAQSRGWKLRRMWFYVRDNHSTQWFQAALHLLRDEYSVAKLEADTVLSQGVGLAVLDTGVPAGRGDFESESAPSFFCRASAPPRDNQRWQTVLEQAVHRAKQQQQPQQQQQHHQQQHQQLHSSTSLDDLADGLPTISVVLCGAHPSLEKLIRSWAKDMKDGCMEVRKIAL